MNRQLESEIIKALGNLGDGRVSVAEVLSRASIGLAYVRYRREQKARARQYLVERLVRPYRN